MTAVAITGFGYCGPRGFGRDAFFRFAEDPRETERTEPQAAEPAQPVSAPGSITEMSVSFDGLKGALKGRGLRAFNREGRLLATACAGAIADAGEASQCPPDSFGLCAGSSSAGLDDYCTLCLEREQWGVARLTPSRGPNAGYNAHLGHVSRWFDVRGVTLGVASGRCSGASALVAAQRELTLGTIECALAGGVEARSRLRSESGSPSHAIVEGAVAFVLNRPRPTQRAYALLRNGGELFLPDTSRATVAQAALWLERAFQRVIGGAPRCAIVSGLAADATRRTWDGVMSRFGPALQVLDVDAHWGDWLGAGSSLAVGLAIAVLEGRLTRAGFEACEIVPAVSLDEQGFLTLLFVESARKNAA